MEPAEAQLSGPLTGTTLEGRYLVEGLLGEGGMGVVYAARHIHLEKKLAVKVLRPDASRDPDLVDRFQREARAATAIGSEHIVDISDFGKTPDGSTYFVMEYLGGSSLGDVLAAGPMSVARTLHVGKQICEALGAAHQSGIVHRDLKPDNIYLVRRGGDSNFVKILDFGIAKVSKGAKRLTIVGQVFGTPHYMSPEQAAGEPVDGRSDIYALGVILYEMATGQVPFDNEQPMAILTKHLYQEPVPPRQTPAGADTPPRLEALIMRCLAKKPDDRPATMEDVAIELESLEYDLPTGIRASIGMRLSDSQSEYRLPADGSGGYRVPKLDGLSQSAERDVPGTPPIGTAIPAGLMDSSPGAFAVASEPGLIRVPAMTTGVQPRAARETDLELAPRKSRAPLVVIGVLAALLVLVVGGLGLTFLLGGSEVPRPDTRASRSAPETPGTLGTAPPVDPPTGVEPAPTSPAGTTASPSATGTTTPGTTASPTGTSTTGTGTTGTAASPSTTAGPSTTGATTSSGAAGDTPDGVDDPAQGAGDSTGSAGQRRTGRRNVRSTRPDRPFAPAPTTEPRRPTPPRPPIGTPPRQVRDPWGSDRR